MTIVITVICGILGIIGFIAYNAFFQHSEKYEKGLSKKNRNK